MNIRTRFAPSPTGNVHIGNMRAAIFNWLYARHTGGQFLLRVEDTDRERSTPEAIETLLQAMDWLGLDVDEDPLYQSTRMGAHLAAAEQLLASGHAYKEDKGGLGQGECIVFKMPEEDMIFEDEIKGTLKKKAADTQDFVIVRSNGTPVFHLANVLDDIEQGITHVIRGDDHIENTYRHIALYKALGADVPKFAHLPMIINAQGKPYSKRDGDAFVGDFKEKGFLGETLFNYLALLGWSPGDDREVLSRDEMTEAFTLERVKKTASRFDLRKLEWLNSQYIKTKPARELVALARPFFEDAGIDLSGVGEDFLAQVVELYRERFKTLRELVERTAFFFKEVSHDDPDVVKLLRADGAKELLKDTRDALGRLEGFDLSALEDCLRSLCETHDVKFKALAQPMRAAPARCAYRCRRATGFEGG